jgi:hypothetical protein
MTGNWKKTMGRERGTKKKDNKSRKIRQGRKCKGKTDAAEFYICIWECYCGRKVQLRELKGTVSFATSFVDGNALAVWEP